jgi:hypothetical protein
MAKEVRTIDMSNAGCKFGDEKNLGWEKVYCPFCQRYFSYDEHHQHTIMVDGKEKVDVKVN